MDHHPNSNSHLEAERAGEIMKIKFTEEDGDNNNNDFYSMLSQEGPRTNIDDLSPLYQTHIEQAG